MLRMTVEGVGFDHLKQTVVVLKDWEGRKLLPIWIGNSEAKSIALELEGARPPRPLSHDLLLRCIRLGGGRVTRIIINDLQESTFYATLDIDTPRGVMHIDARPSDAIAIAVRAKCPVFVDGGALNALIEMNEITVEGEGAAADDEAGAFDAAMEDQLASLTPSDSDDKTANEDEVARFKRLIGELEL